MVGLALEPRLLLHLAGELPDPDPDPDHIDELQQQDEQKSINTRNTKAKIQFWDDQHKCYRPKKGISR